MKNLVSGRILDQIRTQMYGHSGEITFYKMTPEDGEVEIFSTRRGWHLQRDNRDLVDASGITNIWISSDIVPWALDSHLYIGCKVLLKLRNREQAFRITSLRPLQQATSGWLLKCEPLMNSTVPING